MKISEALRTTDQEPKTIEERLSILEALQSFQQASLLSFIGTLAYNDPYFGGVLVRQVETAVKARHEDDAADIGG